MAFAKYERALAAGLMITLLTLTTAAARDTAQGTAQNELSRFEGRWRGNSSCVAKGTACHDETVVYHIVRLTKKSGYVSVTADKLVNGHPVNMGTLEFRYDQDQQALVCEYSQGFWRFRLDGGKMEGTLTAPDNTVFRRVTLDKEP